MSAVDKWKHECLGFIECPSTFDFVYNNPTRKIAIYQLLEDIPNDEKGFDGKAGDIVLGGGSGEAPAFRVSIPESIYFFTKDDWEGFETHEDLFKAFWSPTQAYTLGEGFVKTGWTPDTPIEFWLAENICLLLIDNFEKYSIYKRNSLSKSVLKFFQSP